MLKIFRLPILFLFLSAAAAPAANKEDASRPVYRGSPAAEVLLVAKWMGMLRSDAGLCWIPNCGEGKLALAVAKSSRLLVLAEDADWKNVAATRAAAKAAGLPGGRLLADRSDLTQAPFADNSVDLIVAANLDNKTLAGLPAKELLRVLAPHGLLVFGQTGVTKGATKSDIFSWLKTGGIAEAKVDEYGGLWIISSKPLPQGTDDWSHWYHGPDNNSLSTDTVLKWPYAIQWQGLPFHAPQPVMTLISDGLVFLFIGHGFNSDPEKVANTLLVRNAYNGQELWRRKLPSNFLVHRSCAVATPENLYLLDGASVLLLAPATGKERSRIAIPEFTGEGKWLAISGNILLMLAGEPDPALKNPGMYGVVATPKDVEIQYGFGSQLGAYDLNSKKTLWLHKEEKAIDSRMLGVLAGRLFACAPEGRAFCLDITTGKETWSNNTPEFLAMLGEEKAKSDLLINTTSAELLCTQEAVIIQRTRRKKMVALSPADGHVLWSQEGFGSWGVHHSLAANGKIYTDSGILNPATGKSEGQNWLRSCCSRINGSPDAFYGQAGRILDRVSGIGTPSQGLKTSCYNPCVPGDGMLFSAPASCVCPVSMRGQIAFAPSSGLPPVVRTEVAGRLEVFPQTDPVATLEVVDRDWPTYRANNQRNGKSSASISTSAQLLWTTPGNSVSTTPIVAGGLVFLGRADGTVQALDVKTGKARWEFATGGRILASPTLWENRLYIGSGDGYVYCLAAATGCPLWRFQAAPQKRRIMIYGNLAETWSVDSGVLVTSVETDPAKAGQVLACFAVGSTALEGVHVWAVEARTGKLVWYQGGSFAENPSNGLQNYHPEEDFVKKDMLAQRIPVCSAGGLTSDRRHLWLAGGIGVGRVSYDLADGKMTPPDKGGSRNQGGDIGIFADRFIYLGGSLLYHYSNERKNSSLGFLSLDAQGEPLYPESVVAGSLFSPAWDDNIMVLETRNPLNDHDSIVCLDARKLVPLLTQETHAPLGKKFWERPAATPLKTPLPKLWNKDPNRHIGGLMLAANAVIMLSEESGKTPPERRWTVTALDRTDGHQLWEVQLPAEPAINGLSIDCGGRIIVALVDGSLAGIGATGSGI